MIKNHQCVDIAEIRPPRDSAAPLPSVVDRLKNDTLSAVFQAAEISNQLI